MEFKPIPGGEDYCINVQGLVIKAKQLGKPIDPDKAGRPTVQGNRCYVRIRTKGKERKIPILDLFRSLFPEALASGAALVLETRQGPWELKPQGDAATAAGEEPKPKAQAAKAPVKTAKSAKTKQTKAKVEAKTAESEGPDDEVEALDNRSEDEFDALIGATDDESDEQESPELEEAVQELEEDLKEGQARKKNLRRCLTCRVKKDVNDFLLKRDLCNACYLDREELLRELVEKRKRLKRREEAKAAKAAQAAQAAQAANPG